MPPSFMRFYFSYRGSVDLIVFCDIFVRSKIFAYFQNLLFGEFSVSVRFSSRRSAFGLHVSHIVFVSPDKEMLGINATPYVACVHDIEVRWDFTIMKLIANSVSVSHPPINF